VAAAAATREGCCQWQPPPLQLQQQQCHLEHTVARSLRGLVTLLLLLLPLAAADHLQ
jgi:hypothetical protein